MPLALFRDRCEMVAAFTNPTLHRTISQRFSFPAQTAEAQRPVNTNTKQSSLGEPKQRMALRDHADRVEEPGGLEAAFEQRLARHART